MFVTFVACECVGAEVEVREQISVAEVLGNDVVFDHVYHTVERCAAPHECGGDLVCLPPLLHHQQVQIHSRRVAADVAPYFPGGLSEDCRI